jgi:putative transposase
VLCQIAAVSRSGYYRWARRRSEPPKDHPDYLRIREVFTKRRGRAGWRTIKMALPDLNHKKIRRIMRTYGMRAAIRRKLPYRQFQKKLQEHAVHPNILDRAFTQFVPFSYLSTDVTYLRFLDGFAYLSVVKDIATGEIVAWNVALEPSLELVLDTLEPLVQYRGALIHSDQGFQYTHRLYSTKIQMFGMVQSMSRKGHCTDNAPIESFFGHLKDELDYTRCQTLDELRGAIDAYMRYYNSERKQWQRKKMTPVAYRNHLLSCH